MIKCATSRKSLAAERIGSNSMAMSCVISLKAVRKSLRTDESMRQDFVNLCQHIARCLRKKRLSNTEKILNFYQIDLVW